MDVAPALKSRLKILRSQLDDLVVLLQCAPELLLGLKNQRNTIVRLNVFQIAFKALSVQRQRFLVFFHEAIHIATAAIADSVTGRTLNSKLEVCQRRLIIPKRQPDPAVTDIRLADPALVSLPGCNAFRASLCWPRFA